METKQLDHLRTYLLAFGPALRITALEVRLGLPKRTIYDWLRGMGYLPEKHRGKVEAWARFFGYDPERQYDSFI